MKYILVYNLIALLTLTMTMAELVEVPDFTIDEDSTGCAAKNFKKLKGEHGIVYVSGDVLVATLVFYNEPGCKPIHHFRILIEIGGKQVYHISYGDKPLEGNPPNLGATVNLLGGKVTGFNLNYSVNSPFPKSIGFEYKGKTYSFEQKENGIMTPWNVVPNKPKKECI